jgi:hypothetical protein
MKKYIFVVVIVLSSLYLLYDKYYYNKEVNDYKEDKRIEIKEKRIKKTRSNLINKLINNNKQLLNKSKNSNYKLKKIIYSNYSLSNIYMLKALSNDLEVKNITGENLNKLYSESLYQEFITKNNNRYIPIDDILNIINDN